MTETLFEDAGIVVRAGPEQGPGGGPVLVSFGHMERRAEAPGFWADAPAAHLGWPAIGFLARRPNWFPEASVEAAAPAVRARLAALSGAGPGTVLGYGFSMGGYAALRHGRRLGLTHALAVSPQASIAPGDVPWDPRYRSWHDPALHPRMAVRAGDPPPVAWVLADPGHPEDGAHARWLEAAGTRTIGVPHMGHGAINLLAGRAAAEDAWRAVLAEDATALRALLHRQRRGSPLRQAGLGAALLTRGREAAGVDLLRRAVSLGLDAGPVAEMLALALRRRPARAGRAAGQVAALGILTPEAWVSLVNQVAHAGHRAEALAIAEAGQAALGGPTPLLVPLGHLRLVEGRPGGARAALEAAISHDPGDGWAWAGLGFARMQLGRAKDAAAAAQEAVRLRPADPLPRLTLGAARLALGQYVAAETAFAEAIPLGGGEEARIGVLRARLAMGRRIGPDDPLRTRVPTYPGGATLARLAWGWSPALRRLGWRLRGEG